MFFKKFLVLLLVLIPAFLPAQTLDTEAQSALAAVNTLHVDAEAKIAAGAQALSDADTKIIAVQSQLDAANTQITALQATITAFPGTTIPDLQQTTWSAGITGPGIGASPPASYGWTHTITNALQLDVQGIPGQWDDWLTAIHLYNRLPASTNKIFLDFTLSTSASTLQYAQALEFDLLVVQSGYKYNLSSQIDYSRGGILQISLDTYDAKRKFLGAKWVDTGVTTGKLVSDVTHTIRWEYLVDRDTHSYRYVAFTLDGIRYPVKTALNPPSLTTWRDQICVQLQQDTNPLGGAFSETFDGMKLSLF